MNIILCGLPMSGKTTIGKMLAEKLDYEFIDTDRLIEKAYAVKSGKSLTCREIFITAGEGIFRELEKQQIASLKANLNCVIAIGGGSLNNAENAQILRAIGRLIYLKAPVDVLWRRIQLRGIPAYLDPSDPEKAYHELAAKRMPLYEKAAHTTLDISKLNQQEIIQRLQNVI